MEFINQYFIETLVVIITITVIIIIAILKKPTLTVIDVKKSKKEEPTPKEEIKEKIEVEVKKETTPKEISKRKKRKLIQHEKIVKENFLEFKGTRILIAEDNFINQKVITGLLADSGIDITIANDGQECLNILKEDTNFTLILMDVHMPVLDGFQATREIRKTSAYEHIPVIALSGDTAADDIKNMMNAGMEEHLEKPLKMDSLYDILYVYTTGDEEKNYLSKIQKSKEIKFDIHKGLEICGGDKKFYLEILNEFINNYADSDSKITQYLNNHNTKDADKFLLDIIGLAANIGADHFHNTALELKQSITSMEDMTYLNNLKNFKRSLNHINDLIKEYILNNKE